ncbi:MAG: C-type lectin domain-containing protein [Polyangia bacterium]
MSAERTSMMKMFRTLALFALVTSCGRAPDSGSAASTTEGASVDCPDGWMLWNFSTAPAYVNSDDVLALSGDDGGVVLQTEQIVKIESVTCGATTNSSEGALASTACNGLPSCTYQPTSSCQSGTIAWDCGRGDLDVNGDPVSHTAPLTIGMKAIISCKGAGVKTPDGVAPRVACIPRTCPVHSRRDTNLNCVNDSTKVELLARTTPDSPFVAEPRTAGISGVHDDTGHVALLRGGQYTLFAGVNNPTGRLIASFYGPQRVTFWMKDRFLPKSGTGDPVYGFRCIVASLPVNTSKKIMFPATCTDSTQTTRSAADASRRSGLVPTTFDASYTYADTTLVKSVDVEGSGATVVDSTDTVNSCAPNALAFFYDAKAKQYDLIDYYSQNTYSTSPGYVFDDPRTIEIAPVDLTLRTAEVSVAEFSPFGPSISFDMTWYVANDFYYNPYSLDGDRIKEKGHTAGDGFKNHDPNGSFAPPNLKASLYVIPVDSFDSWSKVVPVLVGSLPLGPPAKFENSSVSGTARINSTLKKMFFDPSSKFYIDPAKGMGAFYAISCLENDQPDQLFESRYWLNGGSPMKAGATLKDANGNVQWSMRLGGNPTGSILGPGCRIFGAPLIIKLDRYHRSLPPVDAQPFDGIAGGAESGSSNTSGKQDADNDQTCSADGSSCSNMEQSGMAASGDFSRSYFSATAETIIDKATGASIDMVGEMLGFQVFDPGSLADKVTWPGKDAAPPHLTLQLEPPWDQIVKKVKQAYSIPNVEWEKGRQTGALGGLAIGWGYKIPIQMGPIPGLITITASVSVGIALKVDFAFKPDEAYPCEGATSPCVEAHSKATDRVSQDVAAQRCYAEGGRLAEASTQAEADALVSTAATESENSFWIGGQLAYDYPLPASTLDCSVNWDAGRCTGGTKTSFRWLSTDDQFAGSTGNDNVTVDSTKLLSVTPSFSSRLPGLAGVIYNRGGSSVTSAYQATKYPYICEFDPAAKTDYFSWQIGVEVGASAGVGLSFCVPNDDVGICIEGGVNFVTVTLEPSYGQSKTTLYDGSNTVIGTRENTEKKVGWEIRVCSAQIVAKFSLFFFSFEVEILSFEGWVPGDGDLYKFTLPVIHNIH